ncbi:NADH:ubiquinone oxidoreductase subunit A3 [Lycorma delicatula]|uniref:NADH:ubiquinone oxidoreductase subunit A3 n=1 Tax=Lycorma delicatula TaxID=130591 RepID=UPI003F511F4C
MSGALKHGASKYGTGISGLWKQGWCEIPEVMATSLLAFGSFFLALHGLNRIKRDKLEDKRYRFDYVVYRDDDPRVKRIKE